MRQKDGIKRSFANGNYNLIIIIIIFILSISGVNGISQQSANNFTINTSDGSDGISIKTIHTFDAYNDYWTELYYNGVQESAWTKVKIERCGNPGCNWNNLLEELLVSVNSTLNGNTLHQNYTGADGSKLNLTYVENSDNTVKLYYDFWGALSQKGYQLTYEVHWIPTLVRNNTDNKSFILNNTLIYNYTDNTNNYTTGTSTNEVGKVFRQWYRTGTGNVLRRIDPKIYVNKTKTKITKIEDINGSVLSSNFKKLYNKNGGIQFDLYDNSSPQQVIVSGSEFDLVSIIDVMNNNTLKKFDQVNDTHWKGEAIYYDTGEIVTVWAYVSGSDFIFAFPHASSPCVNCASGTTTKTVTGMSNGSWINLSQPLNATTSNVTFAGLSSGWNTSYYTTPILVNNTGNASVLTDFQVMVNVTYNSTNMDTNFTSFHLVNETDNTEMVGKFWIDRSNSINSSYANIWLNLSSIPASAWDNTTFALYHRNATEVDVSNGTNTFPFFDDFIRPNGAIGGVWTVGLGTVTISSNSARFDNDPNDPWIYQSGTNNSIVATNIFSVSSANGQRVGGFSVRAPSSGTWVGQGKGLGYGWSYGTVGGVTPNTLNIVDNGVVVATTALTLPVDTSLTGEMIVKNNDNLEVRVWETSSTRPTNPTITYTTAPASTGSNYGWGFNSQGSLLAGYGYLFRVRKYVSTEPIAQLGATGTATTLVYAIPQNHPTSEQKTTNLSSATINLSLTPGTPLQNIQLFSNSRLAFTGTVTISYTNNTETLSETTSSGYYYMNKTINLPEYSTNVSMNDTITNSTFNDATTKGTITNISSNSNITGTTRTGTYINTTFSALPANTTVSVNYTIPYDYLATLSQPTNQTVQINTQATHTITITDSDYVSQNISWDVDSDGTIDGYGISIQKTYSSNGTKTGIVYVNTSTTVSGTWDNQTRIFTTRVNNVPIQSSIGNRIMDEGKQYVFEIISTDADGDSLTYATNATKGSLVGNTFTWTPTYSDSGSYQWEFNTTDNYATDTETITITVTNIPLTINTSTPASDPTTVQGTSQTFTAGTNRSAHFVWMINGTIVQTDNSVNSSTYVNSTASSNSSYNITVNATDEVDTTLKIWNWTVTSSSTSTPSTYAPGGFSGGGTVYISATPSPASQVPQTAQLGIKINLNSYDARIEIQDSDIISALNLYFKSQYRGEYRITITKYHTYSPILNDTKQYFSVSLSPQPELKDSSSIDIFSPTPVDVYQLYTDGWNKLPVYRISSDIHRVQIGSLGVFAIKDTVEPESTFDLVQFIESLKELIIQKDWGLYNKISSFDFQSINMPDFDMPEPDFKIESLKNVIMQKDNEIYNKIKKWVDEPLEKI